MTAPEFFDRLDREVAASRKKLLETRLARSMMDGTVPLEAYKGYLRETYHFTKHTPRFLAAAASRFGDELDAVRRRFLKHTLEEFGHDRFALDDLAALGCDPEEVRASEPLVGTTAMVAFHYYMAEHGNPVGMFGMIYVLESLGQGEGGQAAKQIRERLGIPEAATTFLAEHSVLDVAHLREAKRAILEHVSGEANERAMIYAARAAFELYAFMFDQVWERHESQARKQEPVAALV
jgi:pyrroloquinoline quinone (PQQ) biosynthesis protein C